MNQQNLGRCRWRATDADVAVDGGEWTVEVATEMRAATAAVPSRTQQLAEVDDRKGSVSRWELSGRASSSGSSRHR